jgi:predicted phosphodiesterase
MRVAIFSDVHGNLTALEAVLNHIKKQGADLTLFAGDLCVFGSCPDECVQRLRQEEISCIFGNTDEWISNQPLLSDDIESEEKRRSQYIDDAVDWAWAQLEEKERAQFRSLPFHLRVSPTVNPKDDLFVVHANPQNVDRAIHPPEALQEKLDGEVKQTDNQRRPLLQGAFTGTLVYGHVHVPSVRYWEGLTLANISSVSLPSDGDVRAKYGLFTWEDDNSWTIEHQYVEYDVEQESEWLADLRPPGWEKLSRRLQGATS